MAENNSVKTRESDLLRGEKNPRKMGYFFKTFKYHDTYHILNKLKGKDKRPVIYMSLNPNRGFYASDLIKEMSFLY